MLSSPPLTCSLLLGMDGSEREKRSRVGSEDFGVSTGLREVGLGGGGTVLRPGSEGWSGSYTGQEICWLYLPLGGFFWCWTYKKKKKKKNAGRNLSPERHLRFSPLPGSLEPVLPWTHHPESICRWKRWQRRGEGGTGSWRRRRRWPWCLGEEEQDHRVKSAPGTHREHGQLLTRSRTPGFKLGAAFSELEHPAALGNLLSSPTPLFSPPKWGEQSWLISSPG